MKISDQFFLLVYAHYLKLVHELLEGIFVIPPVCLILEATRNDYFRLACERHEALWDTYIMTYCLLCLVGLLWLMVTVLHLRQVYFSVVGEAGGTKEVDSGRKMKRFL